MGYNQLDGDFHGSSEKKLELIRKKWDLFNLNAGNLDLREEKLHWTENGYIPAKFQFHWQIEDSTVQKQHKQICALCWNTLTTIFHIV